MSSWFELNKNAEGKLCFALKGSNGDTILESNKAYFSKGSVLGDIDLVQHNCMYEDLYERQVSDSGKHFFVLQSPDHHELATSAMHDSAESCEAAIIALKSEGSTQTVKNNL